MNLADLYRTYNRESEAEAVLNEGLQISPGNADLSHSLGLSRVRQGRVAEALPLLAKAASAAPDNVRYAYVHGVALHDSGQPGEGMVVLDKALQRFPNNPELLRALSEYARSAEIPGARTPTPSGWTPLCQLPPTGRDNPARFPLRRLLAGDYHDGLTMHFALDEWAPGPPRKST